MNVNKQSKKWVNTTFSFTLKFEFRFIRIIIATTIAIKVGFGKKDRKWNNIIELIEGGVNK